MTAADDVGSERPSREAVYELVFDPDGRVRRRDRRLNLFRVECERKRHTIAWTLRTTHGWWIAWRSDGGWDYDWADEVTGYTEATCHCGRARRIDGIAGGMR